MVSMRHPAVVAGIAGSALAVTAAALWFFRRKKLSPEEFEKRRRLLINQSGRTIEGVVTDADGQQLQYTYMLRGVEYGASQDVSTLQPYLPDDPFRAIGAVSVKYLRNNPANSIVLCEEWSGLPVHASPPHPDGTPAPISR